MAESTAKLGRHGQRDATLILVAFRHGLRAVEIADLEWSQRRIAHAARAAAWGRRAIVDDLENSPSYVASMLHGAADAGCRALKLLRNISQYDAT